MTSPLVAFPSTHLSLLRLLVFVWALGLPLACSTLPPPSADLQLSNGLAVATFSPTTGGLTSFTLSAFPSPIPFLSDSTTLTLNHTLTLQCPLPSGHTSTPTSLTFTFLCPPPTFLLLTTTYTLQPSHSFLTKHTTITPTTSPTTPAYLITHAAQSLSFPPATFVESGTLHNDLWQPGHDHAVFLRTNTSAGSPGLFAAFQSPFASIVGNSGNCCEAGGMGGGWHQADVMEFDFGYDVGMPVKDVYGEAFTMDGFVIGGYLLEEHWHLNPPPPFTSAPQYDRGYTLNFAERSAFTACVEQFWVGPPRTSSVRVAVGWDSNDYEVDIATPPGVAEYRRLIDRCHDVGITHLIFAPQNTAVSSRFNATDGWGWEEALWLTLGEHIRAGQWVPGRDPVPPSIQYFLDYAASRQVKLMAYVYPPLAFRAPGDSAWLFGGDCCASLAVPQFQRYLADTLIAFARVTGVGGFSFDYNSYGDAAHTTYAQWRGWHWVLRQLRDALPDCVLDHRQIAHVEGPWSWLTGSYAEPLASDENPESLAPAALPSLHYDHSTAYWMRSTNYNYRIYQLAPYATIPGFIGHQTERSFPNGSLAWSDSYTRDFDVMGFPYSLLSNVATAGLNLVHTMLPARDVSEYALLPASLLSFWREWLDWPTQHLSELQRAIPISAPAVDQVDGWVTMEPSGWHGHIFLFNPNYPRLNTTLLMTDVILLHTPPPTAGAFLLSEVYPRPAILRTFRHGDRVTLAVDGDSATVYEVRWVAWEELEEPVLVGVAGVVDVVGQTLRVEGVVGEAGTTSGPVSVWLPSASNASAVKQVVVNGVSVPFSTSGHALTLTRPLSFPGLYLPRSAQVGTVPPRFLGGAYSVTLTVSQPLLDQLAMRAASYPVEWTEDELGVGWLAPHRLLVFASIVAPQDEWNVTAAVDGVAVRVMRSYTSRHAVRSCFQGYFVDLSGVVVEAGQAYQMEWVLPAMAALQFKGVFVENIEPMMVLANVTASSAPRSGVEHQRAQAAASKASMSERR